MARPRCTWLLARRSVRLEHQRIRMPHWDARYAAATLAPGLVTEYWCQRKCVRATQLLCEFEKIFLSGGAEESKENDATQQASGLWPGFCGPVGRLSG